MLQNLHVSATFLEDARWSYELNDHEIQDVWE